MKKRRFLIISLLLVAALALGIGYANLTDDLFVDGSAQILKANADDAFAADVYFSKAIVSEGRGTAVIEADDNDHANDKVTLTVAADALGGAGDSVLCTLTVKNAGDLNANVTVGTPVLSSEVTGDSDYFTVSVDPTNKTINAGEEGTFIVTVKVAKTPDKDVSATFTIEMTATSLAAE